MRARDDGSRGGGGGSGEDEDDAGSEETCVVGERWGDECDMIRTVRWRRPINTKFVLRASEDRCGVVACSDAVAKQVPLNQERKETVLRVTRGAVESTAVK